MKTLLLLTTIFATQLFGVCFADIAVLPEIPIPKLTAIQALEIAQQHMTNSTNYTLVGIEWCKSSAFQPRYSDGTHYTPADDHPNEYSWFVTCIYHHPKGNSVDVLRIKDDGQIGRFYGIRT